MGKIRIVKSDTLKVKADTKKEIIHIKEQTQKVKLINNIHLKADINFIKKKSEVKSDKHIQLSGTKETTVNKTQNQDGTIQIQKKIKKYPKINS